MMMWKFVITILLYCATPSQGTFGDFFKSEPKNVKAHVAPSTYSVPIFQYGPPKMKFGGPSPGYNQGHGGQDKFSSLLQPLTDKFQGHGGPSPGFKQGFGGQDKFSSLLQPLTEKFQGHGGPGPGFNQGHGGQDKFSSLLQPLTEKFQGHGGPGPGFNQGHGGQDKFSSLLQPLTDKFSKKPNFKSISKVSHGPRYPINLKNFGGPKVSYGPPQRPRPQYGVPQHAGHGGHGGPPPQIKGHCDGWIPILGPAVHQHHPEPSYVPDIQELQVVPQEPLHLPEQTFPVENIVPHTAYGVPGHEENNLHVVQSNFGVETDHAEEQVHHVDNGFGGDVGLQAPIIPNVLSNELSGGFDIVQSHGIELTNFNSGNSFNQLPPAVHAPTATYGPPHPGPQVPFRTPHYKQSGPMFHGQKSPLGIRYGTVSGNLKPWPIPGTAPKYPLSFREPVPQGLIESIGHNVQHLDNYGVKLHPQNNIYLPPPPSPLPISNLHALPLKQAPNPFLTQGYYDPHQQYQQQQAHESNVVAITHHHQCTHGPNLGHDGFHNQQLVNGVYEAASSNLVAVEEKSQSGRDDISSYGPPASGTLQASGTENQEHKEPLPGLDGLDVISAQKSQTVEIPTGNAGNSGTAYDIQFQQSIASSGQGGLGVNHDQIVNNGLLQSIISAVEQPQQQVPQLDQRTDTSDDVKIVFNTTENIEALKPKADN